MIRFEYVKWVNFLSTGNNAITIDLMKSKTTLVVGQNGAGKSTILDAISFALFGKAHRSISKNQLVNSINNKGCEVEVVFSANNKKFKIIRSIKPNKFEIWSDGQMLNQESHARDYQQILEQNILKLNHKSFHQVVVLGSSSFIPFMQLTGPNRRDVIEDLLDIGMFSKMNMLLKEKVSLLKDKVLENNNNITLVSHDIANSKKYIKSITEINLANRDAKLKSIEEKRNEIDTITKENASLTASIDERLEPTQEALQIINKRKASFDSYKLQFEQEIRKVVKEAKFYEDNENCPTCEQTITPQLKDKHIGKAKERAKELQEGIDFAKANIDQIETEALALTQTQADIQEQQRRVHSNIQLVSSYTRIIEQIQDELNSLTEGTEDLAAANKELLEHQDRQLTLQDIKFKLNEQSSYYGVVSELLKDSGIKTKIIRQYLPVINKLVNQYLQTLDFYVHFDLDEEFKETIRSRHRDEFTYSSFSEGEKQRIDLALLFTWRMIAKMKNSVNTNLLILDETFDSSLDHDGIDNLMKILHTLEEDTNIFVISHKGDLLEGKFGEKIEFYKEKNFSKIKA